MPEWGFFLKIMVRVLPLILPPWRSAPSRCCPSSVDQYVLTLSRVSGSGGRAFECIAGQRRNYSLLIITGLKTRKPPDPHGALAGLVCCVWKRAEAGSLFI